MLRLVVVELGMIVRVGDRADRDRDDGLVGYTAAVSLSEHDQPL